jgi:hypothetical protein
MDIFELQRRNKLMETVSSMKVKMLDGGEFDLTQDMLDGLKVRLKGPLLLSGDSGFDEARTVWNAMIDRKPALVVRCLGVADVVACIRFAREHNLLLCIKGGGTTSPLATADGALMLDMSLMRCMGGSEGKDCPRTSRMSDRRCGS